MRKGPLAHLDPQGCRESWDRKVTKETHASCVTVWTLQVYQAPSAQKESKDLLVPQVAKVKRVSLECLEPLADLDLKAPLGYGDLQVLLVNLVTSTWPLV